MKVQARVIAYYLPQFHPIPENDQWWGKGFTEWTNVGKARPLFKGHYQPRVPADLGYYDLRMPEIREAQADMAREAGIEGFMYWHYWFGNGKRVLEKPFNDLLESGKPDFPFCLGWANHSWTTHSWNSKSQWKKNSTIIQQLYPGEKDYVEHFYTVLPAFKDKRYITVDEKPLFIIYAPLDFPDVQIFLNIWRKLARKNGLKDIHFVGQTTGWLSYNDKILAVGFDAVNSNGQWEAECAVNGKWYKLIRHKIVQQFGGVVLQKYNYAEIIRHLFNEQDRDNNVYPTIIPQWDRSARSGRRSIIYHGSTPALFGKHITAALQLVAAKPSEHKIIFLKSWNEWGEGNYMEPDLKFGKGYLEILKEKLVVQQPMAVF